MMDPRRIARMIELFNEYGAAKFGDEWWPGNPRPWIGEEQGAELQALIEEFGSDDALHAVIE